MALPPPLPVIDVIGPTYHNKGDQLMLAALEVVFAPAYRISCLDGGCHVRAARRLLIGIPRKLPVAGGHLRLLAYRLAPLVGREARARLHLAHLGEIAATVDCSGYLYGDPWPVPTRKAAWRREHYRRIKARGRPVVFLPQAFGPFTDPAVAAGVRSLLETADFVACRDQRSLAHVRALGIEASRTGYVPDISVLAPAAPPADDGPWADTVAVVPNLRMVDKVTGGSARAYVAMQARLLDRVARRGLRPVLLLHETFDRHLAAAIGSAYGRDVAIIDADPLATKGIIGACRAVLTSRFHALVSALSQATPALATAWTHKYQELLGDYGMEGALLTVGATVAEIDDALDRILEEPARSTLVATLRHRAAVHRQRVLDFVTMITGQIAVANQHRRGAPAGLGATQA